MQEAQDGDSDCFVSFPYWLDGSCVGCMVQSNALTGPGEACGVLPCLRI